MVSKFQVEAGIPTAFLEPGEIGLREFAPIWFDCEINAERGLADAVVYLRSGAAYC